MICYDVILLSSLLQFACQFFYEELLDFYLLAIGKQLEWTLCLVDIDAFFRQDFLGIDVHVNQHCIQFVIGLLDLFALFFLNFAWVSKLGLGALGWTISVNCLNAIVNKLFSVDRCINYYCFYALADESIILIPLLQLLQAFPNLHLLFLDEQENIVELVTA